MANYLTSLSFHECHHFNLENFYLKILLNWKATL